MCSAGNAASTVASAVLPLVLALRDMVKISISQ